MSSRADASQLLEGSSSMPSSSQHTLSTDESDPIASSQGQNPGTGVPHPVNSRVATLQVKKVVLEETLEALRQKRQEMIGNTKLPSGLAMPDEWSDQHRSEQAMTTANGIIKDHISMLHKYNEIKDIAQGLIGMIADRKGERVADVMGDFGVTDKD